MQADFAAERRRRRLVLILGLVLGLAAAAAVFVLLSRQPSGTGPVPTPVQQTIVVAAVDIKSHSQILTEMLTTLQVPESPVFNNVATDPTQVLASGGTVGLSPTSKITWTTSSEPHHADPQGSASRHRAWCWGG